MSVFTANSTATRASAVKSSAGAFKLKALATVCAVSASLAMALAANAASVDVLVAYDSAAKNKLGGEPAVAMKSWINQINSFYVNSKVDIELRLVGTMYHEEGGDMATMVRALQRNSTVRAKRDETGADFVVMLSPKASCGIAYISVLSEYAYSVVGPQCGAMTMAHEIGHNMGLTHSRRQGDKGGYRYSYGLGHGADYSFATMMSYSHLFGTSRTGKFSNPNVSCNGQPCGVPAGKPNEADAARAINNVRNEVANFRQTVVSSDNSSASKAPPSNTTASKPVKKPSNNTGGTYSLQAVNSKKCVDVSGNRKYSGATVAQWSCHGGLNQQWQSTQIGDFVSLKAKHSGMCLAVANSSKNNNARVVQASCNTSDSSQLWKLETRGKSVNVENRRSGKFLDIRGESNDNRAAVQQYSPNGGDNQRFVLKSM